MENFRAGWTSGHPIVAQSVPALPVPDDTPWTGVGPIHAVRQDTDVALCGATCTFLPDGPMFAGMIGQCRVCNQIAHYGPTGPGGI